MYATENPFFVLGATGRDDRRRIMELAEERSLLGDADEVARARAALTTPSKRLAAEIGWFPGLGPRRVEEALRILESDPAAVRRLAAAPPLAQANLLVTGLSRAIDGLEPAEIADWISEISGAFDEIEVESVRNLINEDRVLARFPEVTEIRALEEVIDERRQFFRSAVTGVLDNLPATTLLEVVTGVVDEVTEGGEVEAPLLIHDLVDAFEVGAQDFLQREAANIERLIEKLRDGAARGSAERVLDDLVGRLEDTVRNWDRVAQPIQLSARSRGLAHSQSHHLAGELRGLAVQLFNEHDHLAISQRLTALLQTVFAEVDEVAERADEDASTLQDIADKRLEVLREQREQSEKWRREVTYEAEWGMVFKKRLKISPDGVEWEGSRLPLDQISRTRWGATRHYVNGIPTGTTYSIFVGTPRDGAAIELKKGDIFEQFVDRLWKGAGLRLLNEMLDGLKSGRSYRFGTAVVDDHGVQLERRRMFSANEKVHCRWQELTIGHAAGCFVISSRNDKKVSAQLSYQEVDNVHILELAMRVFWERGGDRISSLLSRES